MSYKFPPGYTISQAFLVFNDLDSFKNTGQVFCRVSFDLSLSNVFLIVRPGLWAWGRKTAGVNAILNISY